VSRRFFRHGELQLVLLALLSERPMHNYEVMSELARLFGPRYRPSPGSVYPAAEALEVEGLIQGKPEAGRTVFRTSSAGANALAERADTLAALEVRTGTRVRRSESLEPLFARFKARLEPLSSRADVATVAEILDRAATEIESLDRLTTNERKR
jgi:DNA-binding PadR family transcriptional regulator